MKNVRFWRQTDSLTNYFFQCRANYVDQEDATHNKPPHLDLLSLQIQHCFQLVRYKCFKKAASVMF